MSARARLVPLLMCLLLALPAAVRTGRAAAEADAAPTAQADAAAADLTRQCTLEASFPSRLTRLTDGDLESAQRFEAGESVSVSWTEDVPVAAVYFAFYREIAPFTVLQYDAAGALLSEHAPGPLWNNVVEPLPDARRVTIRAEAELAVRATELLGLDFAGVDVLFGRDGPLLCEVNSNAHFKTTLECTGVNMAVEIMRHISRRLEG